jgi:hypothetical protein
VKCRTFVAALVFGAVVRLAALPLPGTGDVGIFKIWTFNGAIHPPTELYGVGGSPTEWRVLEFNGATGTVVYPPLVLYELAVVGRVYKWINEPRFPDSPALAAAIKTPNLIFDIGLAFLIFFSVRRTADPIAARWATITYWLNPAPILGGSMLGYLDPLFMLPATGALFAGVIGWPVVAGGLIAAASLTKPQAAVLAPAVALAIWTSRDRDRWVRLSFAAAGGLLAAGAVVVPIVAAGAWLNMLESFKSLTRHDMLSGNACNLWWVITYLLRVWYAFRDMGIWPAITMRTRILGISRVMELGYPNPRIVGAFLTIPTMAWGLWTAWRARGWFLMAALGAFLLHAYATLAAQVHENHLFGAIPLLVIAGAGLPRYRPLMWVVSAIFALNLNLLYGISEYGVGYAVPRAITIVDATVLLAFINCAAFVWHAALFRAECSRALGVPATAEGHSARAGGL